MQLIQILFFWWNKKLTLFYYIKSYNITKIFPVYYKLITKYKKILKKAEKYNDINTGTTCK